MKFISNLKIFFDFVSYLKILPVQTTVEFPSESSALTFQGKYSLLFFCNILSYIVPQVCKSQCRWLSTCGSYWLSKCLKHFMNICDRRHRAKHPWKEFSIVNHKRPRKTSNIPVKISSTAKKIAVNNFCILSTSNLSPFVVKLLALYFHHLLLHFYGLKKLGDGKGKK